MKTPHRSLRIFLALTSFVIAGSAGAQSVTIGAISGSQFCIGDSITITFTATGKWNPGNAFILQLSDPMGSFSSSFKKLGSLVDSLPGTFTLHSRLPDNLSASTHYRLRVLAASPYIISANNGSDIAIGTPPNTFSFEDYSAGSIGTPITFLATSFSLSDIADLHYIAFWDFGSGATPAKATTNVAGSGGSFRFSQDVTYSTTGDKTVTITIVKPGGCSSEVLSSKLHIYDCSMPSIPYDAIVVNSDAIGAQVHKAYWVNPGFTLIVNQWDTIFAEPGSTIAGGGNSVLYMKPGSILTYSGTGNSVIFGDGASIPIRLNNYSLNCHTLDFDYSNAPPNAAHTPDGVTNASLPSITISPNPTRGIISIQGASLNDLNISVLNILGETVMLPKNPRAPDFTLDLSKLVPGTYYIRFSSANSVVTKKVMRE